MNKVLIAYRIVEIKNKKVHSLFHGTNGSRVIPVSQWVDCKKGTVTDGSHGYEYEAGWHFLPTEEEANNFFNSLFKVKENRYVIPCFVSENIHKKREKKNGKRECYLANKIFIPQAVLNSI